MILVERSLINGSKEKERSLFKLWFFLFVENVIFLLIATSPLLITELMLGGGIETEILERLYIMLPIILGLIALFSFVPFIILELFSLAYSLKEKIEKVYKEIVPDEKS